MCNSIRWARAEAGRVAGAFLAVAITHAAVQLLFYRGRVMNRVHVGDFAMLVVPAFIAWFAYLLVFVCVGRIRSPSTPFLAFGATCFSFWAGMIAALNLYGS